MWIVHGHTIVDPYGQGRRYFDRYGAYATTIDRRNDPNGEVDFNYA